MDTERIRQYYVESFFDYKWIYRATTTKAIHFGYYDEEHTRHPHAVENTNRVLADEAGITPSDRVLDAGCGIGGSSIWLASEIGCDVVGIDITPENLERARQYVRRQELDDHVGIVEGDFTATGFDDAAFDIVWAIETVCHAENKDAFIEEAARLLDGDGRVAMLGFFRTDAEQSPEVRRWYEQWLDGWAMAGHFSLDDAVDRFEAAGFDEASVRDITDAIVPGSKKLYLATRMTAPIARALYRLGFRGDVEEANRKATRRQYELLQSGAWRYCMLTAKMDGGTDSEG